SEVFAPLGHGGHVDHLLSREVVLALADDGALDPRTLRFYEDTPSSLFDATNDVAAHVAARVAPSDGLSAGLLPCTASALERTGESLRTYRLQVPQGIVTRVIRHNRALAPPGAEGGERIWRVAG